VSTVRKTHTEAWWENAPAYVIRCIGHYKDGTPCRTEAHPGATVCHKHGAAAPAVQAAAATRIQYSVDEAAQRLVDWMKDDNVDMRERVKIAHDLLDRGGLGAMSKHLVGVAQVDPVEALFRSIAADPAGLTTPEPVQAKVIQIDAAQAAIDAREEGPDWDELFGPENRLLGTDDVVDAVLVDDNELPPNTVRVEGSMSHNPPKWLADDLERTETLRRAGLW
jgi:hypothetical protein